jgi:hypothetical protein
VPSSAVDPNYRPLRRLSGRGTINPGIGKTGSTGQPEPTGRSDRLEAAVCILLTAILSLRGTYYAQWISELDRGKTRIVCARTTQHY